MRPDKPMAWDTTARMPLFPFQARQLLCVDFDPGPDRRGRTVPSADFLLAGTSRRDTTGIVIEKEKFQPSDTAFAGLMRRGEEALQMQRAA